jgi:hypothetical protein
VSSRSKEHPYRERGDDVRRRIGWLWDEIDPLHARIAELYWQHLGDGLRTRIEELRAGSNDDDSSQLEHERALAIYRDELRHAIGEAPRIERWLTALPNAIHERALGDPWNPNDTVVLLAREWTGSAAARQQSLAARIARWVGGHDSSAKLLQGRFGSVRVNRFEVHGAPYMLQADGVPLDEDATIMLVTPVARAVAPLTAEEKQWAHSLGEVLRFHSDAKTGDSVFDERYFVEADQRAARTLLNQEVRGALLHFARFAPPKLVVGDGLARLTWRYLPLAEMLDRAVSILGALRHTKLDIDLLA